jgi:hypothetical protein
MCHKISKEDRLDYVRDWNTAATKSRILKSVNVAREGTAVQ